jgi:ribosome-associated protein
LKKQGQPVYRRSGDAESGWLLLDYVDVVVHIMTTEARDYYDLESLWSDAPRVVPSP